MKRLDLLKALEIVKPGLATKEIIEQTTSFAFIKGHVVTYNDQISISHPIEDIGIEGAIKANELYSLLSRIKKDDVSLEINENEVRIKAGRTKAGIPLQTEVTLPIDEELKEKGKWKKLPDNFNDLLLFTSKACSSDMSQPVITCVHVNENIIEASDSFRVIQSTLESKVAVNKFLIPSFAVKLVAKMNPTHIAEGKGWIHFKTKENTILSCRIFEETFPDVSGFINIKGKELTFPKTLGEILERAKVFANRDHAIDEIIDISIKENKIKLTSKAENGAWFEEVAKFKYDGDTFNFSITPYLLHDIIAQNHTCIIKKTALEFKGENWLYLSMLRDE